MPDFIQRMGELFDDADYVELRREDEYNHARVRGFESVDVPFYEAQLEDSDLEHSVNDYSKGLEIEVWEDL